MSPKKLELRFFGESLWSKLKLGIWNRESVFVPIRVYHERNNYPPIPDPREEEIGEITPISVTQGDTYSNSGGTYHAAYAVDKDLSTFSSTYADTGAGWLQLQFDNTYFIHKVVIYYRFVTNWYLADDWCSLSASNFRACVDTNTNVDVSVYQGGVRQKSCGTLRLSYGLERSDQIYTLFCNAAGNTVKLSKNSGKIALYEVVVASTSTAYH